MKLAGIYCHTAVPSPDGNLLLTYDDQSLKVHRVSHSSGELSILREIHQPREGSKTPVLRWAPISHCAGEPSRFLFATENVVKVFDLNDPQWSATVKAPQGISSMHFGEHDDALFLYDTSKSLLSVYDLFSGRRVDIKNPKFVGAASARHRHFVLLSRQETQDVVTVHAPLSYEIYATFKPQTVDAQGLKLSPDGKWIAVWESANMGYKVLIYTVDGHLYRTFREDYYDDALQGLGVRSTVWSPDGQFLAIGGYNSLVNILNTKKFTVALQLSHVGCVSPSKAAVYVENVSSDGPGGRSYSLSNAMIHLPTAAKPTSGMSTGIADMCYNADGTLLATKYEAYLTTVWIWDLATLSPRAILIQHSEVQDISWHTHNKDWLIIQCARESKVVRFWDASDSNGAPHVIDLTLQGRDNIKSKVSFIRCFRNGKEYVALCHELDDGSSNIVWPFERPQYSPQLVAESETLSANDLTLGDATLHGDFNMLNGTIQEDTFIFRRGVSAY